MATPMESEEGGPQPINNELSPRNKLYKKISENLTEAEVVSLQMLLITDNLIARGRVQNASPHEIFNMLEDDGRMGVGNLGLLKDLLRELKKGKLAEEAEDVEKVEGMAVSILNKRSAPEDTPVPSSPKHLKMGSDDDDEGSDHSDSSAESGIHVGCSASTPQDMETQDLESGSDLGASAEDVTDDSMFTTAGLVHKRIDHLRKKIAKLTRNPTNVSQAKTEELFNACQELGHLSQILDKQRTGELKVDISLLNAGTQQEFQEKYETGALGLDIQKEVKQIMRQSTCNNIANIKPDVKVDFIQNTAESTNCSPAQRATIKVTAEDVDLEESCRLDKDSAVRQLFKYLVDHSEQLHPIMEYLNSFHVQIRDISYGSIGFECICLTPESAVHLQEEYDGQRLHAQFQRVISSLTILTEFGIKTISLAVKLRFADEGPRLHQLQIDTSSNMLDGLHLDDKHLLNSPDEQHNQEISTPAQTEDSVTNLGKLQIEDETAEASRQQSAAIQPIADQLTSDLPTSCPPSNSASSTVICKTDICTAEQYTVHPSNESRTTLTTNIESEESDWEPTKDDLRNKLYKKIEQSLFEHQRIRLIPLIRDHHVARWVHAGPYELFRMLEAEGEIGEGDLGLLKELLTQLGEKQLVAEAHNVEMEEVHQGHPYPDLWVAARQGNCFEVEILLCKGVDVNMAGKDGRTLLWIAAKNNHISTVEILLCKGAYVNMADKNGRTPLWIAAQQGHLPTVKMLLSKGADVNMADKDGRTPLWIAAQQGHLPTAEMLPSKGADVNMTDKDGRTPLWIAAQQGHLPTVEMLPSKGADVNMADKDGQTPLWIAEQKGHHRTVDMLLSKGADVNMADKDGRTRLWIAAQKGCQMTAEMLLSSGADVNMADKDGRTPLLVALQQGHLSTLQMLLSKGADVNLAEKDGRTPLRVAVEWDHLPTVEMLLNKGADVNMADNKGYSPLQAALDKGQWKISNLIISFGANTEKVDIKSKGALWHALNQDFISLAETAITKGADVNMADKDGRTPLWIAAQKGHVPTAKMLLSKGADVNMADKDGRTPLLVVLQQGHLPTVHILLKNGADVNKADNLGHSPLQAALDKGQWKTSNFLINIGANTKHVDIKSKDVLWQAAHLGFLNLAEVVISKGGDVNMANNDGRTPLWIAAQQGHLPTVEMLLSKGADVNMADKDGRTPLWIAGQCNHLPIVAQLLRKGADVNKADKYARTPLWTAARNGNLPSVEMLLSNGADVNMADKDGSSPIYVAKREGHSAVEEILMKHKINPITK